MHPKLQAAVIQMRHRESLAACLEAADAALADARAAGARLVVLPEYFFVPDGERPSAGLAEASAPVREWLAEASRRHGLALVGNVLERSGDATLNVAYAFEAGRLAGRQEKIHPMPGEERGGITGGHGYHVFDLLGVRAGVLVCADVLYPEAARILSLKGAEVLLNPVMSPNRGETPQEDMTRDARSALFIARAYDSAAFVLKAGGFAPVSRKAVARSLIAAPWGLLARYRDEWGEETLHAELDFAPLREFRKTHRGLEARRPDTYGPLVDPSA